MECTKKWTESIPIFKGLSGPDDRSMEFERLTRTNSDLQATIARLNQDIDRLTQENRMAKMRSGSESERLA
jgi:outer membrane murein-binding lipoprotein Lpp